MQVQSQLMAVPLPHPVPPIRQLQLAPRPDRLPALRADRPDSTAGPAAPDDPAAARRGKTDPRLVQTRAGRNKGKGGEVGGLGGLICVAN
eukprot:scaffold5819_cov115-Isochrysis_galbana.AAC.5